MALPIRFLVLVLFSVGLAAKVGDWTLSDFSRYCYSDTSCAYHFLLGEDNLNGVNPNARFPCDFTVPSEDGKPANETDFENVPCQQGPPWYRVNGGWNPDGYVVIVVTNTVENAYAFFGYNDVDLEGGTPVGWQTQPAFEVGTFVDNDIAPRQVEESRDFWEGLELLRRTLIPCLTGDIPISPY